MKYIPTVASILLGLLFLMAGVTFFLGMMPAETLEPGSPKAMFTGAFGPTGYLAFVKVFEIVGAVFVMIPKTRNFGLLVLGPIILNILAFTVFIAKGEGLYNPMLILICVAALYLLFDARKAFAGLLR